MYMCRVCIIMYMHNYVKYVLYVCCTRTHVCMLSIVHCVVSDVVAYSYTCVMQLMYDSYCIVTCHVCSL